MSNNNKKTLATIKADSAHRGNVNHRQVPVTFKPLDEAAEGDKGPSVRIKVTQDYSQTFDPFDGGNDIEPYRQRFEIKSKDQAESWSDLIHLCQVLNETPDDQLKEKLEAILNVEGALWFLAVDVALANSDGYWTRASDYSIYQDTDGKFHILPHDMNEALKLASYLVILRNGKVIQEGDPYNVANHPVNQYVERFFVGAHG